MNPAHERDTFYNLLVAEWKYTYRRVHIEGLDMIELKYLSHCGDTMYRGPYRVPCDVFTDFEHNYEFLADNGAFVLIKKPNHSFMICLQGETDETEYSQGHKVARYTAWRILHPVQEHHLALSISEHEHYMDSNTLEYQWYPLKFPKPWRNAWEVCKQCENDIAMYRKMMPTGWMTLCASCRFTTWSDGSGIERINKRGDGINKWFL